MSSFFELTIPNVCFWAIVIMNALTFILYAYDKVASKTGKVSLRISEKSLILLALFFGSGGALLAMIIFRHKTKHKLFLILVPLLLILQTALIIYLKFFMNR